MSVTNNQETTGRSTELPALTVNMGPLTTPFTPPPDCFSYTLGGYGHRVDSADVSTIIEWRRGYTCSGTRLDAREECFPPRWGAVFNTAAQKGPNAVYPVYSPGSVCPAGYATSCVMVYSTPGGMQLDTITDDGPIVTKWSILKEGETAVGCCPIGYTCYLPYSCAWAPSISATITGDMNKVCYASSKSRSVGTTVIAKDMIPKVVAPQIVLIRNNNNNNTISTTSATNTSTVVQPTISNKPEGDLSSGLSTAAKAAIGTAVPLGIIILALAGYILFFRRRNRNKQDAEPASEQDGAFSSLNKPELDATSSPLGISVSPYTELDGTPSLSPGLSTFVSDQSSEGNRLSELQGSMAARIVAGMWELQSDEERVASSAFSNDYQSVAAFDAPADTATEIKEDEVEEILFSENKGDNQSPVDDSRQDDTDNNTNTGEGSGQAHVDAEEAQEDFAHRSPIKRKSLNIPESQS